MNEPIQILRDTLAELTAKIVPVGMPFYIEDTQQSGVGDGASTVAQLLTTGADYAPSAAGTDTPTIPACARQFDVLWQLAAGAGAYTRKLVLATANRIERDKVRVRLELPASTNPTAEVRNATAGGTLRLTQTGDAVGTQIIIATFIFRSGAWVVLDAHPSQL